VYNLSADSNVYCAVLAGGSGSRMNSPVPKQFLMLGDAPVFVHSVRTLLKDSRIKQLWIGSNGDWYELAQEQIKDYCGNDERIILCEGGIDREGTLLNILNGICKENEITEDDVVLIHDAVRPFVTQRIIDDVIAEMRFCSACNTVIPVNDTIVSSENGKSISGIPVRSELFAGQSPQGFKIKALIDAFNTLDAETRAKLTETTKVCFVQGIPIHIVKGEFYNFKITTPYDLQLANFVLEYIKSLDK